MKYFKVKLLSSSSSSSSGFAHLCCVCFIIFFIFQKSTAQNATTDPSEVRALNSIFEQWDAQAVTGYWNISGEPCSGIAITGTDSDFESPANNPSIICDCTFDSGATCHITKLVYGLNKRGVIPEEIVTLQYLTFLKIDRNYFTGSLPAFIGNLSRLELLSLAHNALSGPVPKELGNLKQLLVLLTEFNDNEVLRVIAVALLCTQASPMLRPPMSRVVNMLTGDIEVGTVTSKPSYLTDWDFNDITNTFMSDDITTSSTSHSRKNDNPNDISPGVDPLLSPLNVSQIREPIAEGR